MAASPIVRDCRLLSRGFVSSRTVFSPFPPNRIAITQRDFATSTRLHQEALETLPTGSGAHARSIAMFKVPKRAVKSDIKDMLLNKGYDVQRISMLMDRFTFSNTTRCFVELGDEKQASKAVKELDKSEFQSQNIFVQPLREDFVWTRRPEEGRYFYDKGPNACRDAALPLIEGRRTMLSVQTPGWGVDQLALGARNTKTLEIINQYFSKYGIENLGALHPFYGDKKKNPRMLCFMDFKTKGGADQAIRELHDTEVEGRLIWLQISKPASWRAHQIGKVDKAVLAELQEKGLVPEETEEDKFSTPITKKVSKQGKGSKAEVTKA